MNDRIDQLRQQLREDPSSRLFFQLGELLRKEGQLEEAAGVLRAGLTQYPRYVAAWVSLGRCLFELSSYEPAEEAFHRALVLDPENPIAARMLGETAMGREDWVLAIKSLKRARVFSPPDTSLEGLIDFVEQQLAAAGRLEGPPTAQVASPAPVEVFTSVAPAPEPLAAQPISPVTEPVIDVPALAAWAPEPMGELEPEAAPPPAPATEPDAEAWAESEPLTTTEPPASPEPEGWTEPAALPTAKPLAATEAETWAASDSESEPEPLPTAAPGAMIEPDAWGSPADEPEAWAEAELPASGDHSPEAAASRGAELEVTTADLRLAAAAREEWLAGASEPLPPPPAAPPESEPAAADDRPLPLIDDAPPPFIDDEDVTEEITLPEPPPGPQVSASPSRAWDAATTPINVAAVGIEAPAADADFAAEAAVDEPCGPLPAPPAVVPAPAPAAAFAVFELSDDDPFGDPFPAPGPAVEAVAFADDVFGGDSFAFPAPPPAMIADAPLATREQPGDDGWRAVAPPELAAVVQDAYPDDESADDTVQVEASLPLPTVTLARLALAQGDEDLARRTLDAVLEAGPATPEALALQAELEGLAAAPSAPASGLPPIVMAAVAPAQGSRDQRLVAGLVAWMDGFRAAAEELER